jgi:hypothetical protein
VCVQAPSYLLAVPDRPRFRWARAGHTVRSVNPRLSTAGSSWRRSWLVNGCRRSARCLRRSRRQKRGLVVGSWTCTDFGSAPINLIVTHSSYRPVRCHQMCSIDVGSTEIIFFSQKTALSARRRHGPGGQIELRHAPWSLRRSKLYGTNREHRCSASAMVNFVLHRPPLCPCTGASVIPGNHPLGPCGLSLFMWGRNGNRPKIEIDQSPSTQPFLVSFDEDVQHHQIGSLVTTASLRSKLENDSRDH